MLNYFKLPNKIFELDLSANEFAVLTYLQSIYTNIKSRHGHQYKRVRQATIADKCGLSERTISRIVHKLSDKGYLAILRGYRADRLNGTYTYVVNDFSGSYTMIDRIVFEYGLSPKQLKVYLYICKAIDPKLGYCWDSSNDLARAVKFKRSEIIHIVSDLVLMRRIRKMRKMRYDRPKVYSDNSYSLRAVRFIKKKCNIKELKPSYEQGFKLNLLVNTLNNALNIVYHNNSTYNSICQAFFAKKSGKCPGIVMPKFFYDRG